MTIFTYSRAYAAAFLLMIGPVTLQAGSIADAEPVLRFAVLGDAEPKPLAEFPGLASTVDHVNTLLAEQPMDFVIGVGDIAHKGTLIQYDNASLELERLSLPFYPIMGNEEHHASVARFLHYANRWNADKAHIGNARYVIEQEQVALVLASPDHGRDFDNSGVQWIAEQIDHLHPKPVFLVVHGAQVGIFPENADKGIRNTTFDSVTRKENLAAIISGDLHMDMDRVQHSKKIGHVHYLHIPALERTKIPDETRHITMFRVVSLYADGKVVVDTYEAGAGNTPLERHDYRFTLFE
ncbi:metallophosphoesterase family protein [Ectothiorhodospira lacustris]|uniref:metallophosphoesterase family protein n=1 Tax=Ectothiorhodospira lacustris TaxID=2899127 RepID=UPI001EE87012|nr:metallophosphoesterase [Ectothiorhodospira lacustris]MCG5511131.1 metallophosphoesterase [Ectothiorhodospira lacustris]MCG5522795.1 metallophosphoesterase [Ectothiorhodospira lacustris]